MNTILTVYSYIYFSSCLPLRVLPPWLTVHGLLHQRLFLLFIYLNQYCHCCHGNSQFVQLSQPVIFQFLVSKNTKHQCYSSLVIGRLVIGQYWSVKYLFKPLNLYWLSLAGLLTFPSGNRGTWELIKPEIDTPSSATNQ